MLLCVNFSTQLMKTAAQSERRMNSMKQLKIVLFITFLAYNLYAGVVENDHYTVEQVISFLFK